MGLQPERQIVHRKQQQSSSKIKRELFQVFSQHTVEFLTANSKNVVPKLNGNCLCYRPPNCSLFIDYFECLLANLRVTTGRICIVGDFNMPTIDWEYVIDLSNSTDGVGKF